MCMVRMNLQLIILLFASKLSLNAGLNDPGKQIAALQIKLDKQDAELKQLKSIADTQNEKIGLLNKLNEDLQQRLHNQSAMIDDLQNKQEQLENFTYQSLAQSKSMVTDLDGSGFQQELYDLFNISDNQQVQIEYLMDQRENDTVFWQMMQAQINTVNVQLLNITYNQYKQIKNVTKQNERLQNAIQLDRNNSNKLISALNESHSKQINEQRNELINIKSFVYQGVNSEDYMRLELLSAKGYLGCPYDVCDLRTCPSFGNNFRNFDTCYGEGFQILGEGGGSIKSGQRVRFRYVNGENKWLGCPENNRCNKRSCPGAISSTSARNLNTCWGERFVIYARGRDNGEDLLNQDIVVIYFPAKKSEGKPGYITIQGSRSGADTSLSSCLGSTPPTYFSYSRCPTSVFRIHRKP